jgi:hypothetical protein
VGKDIVGSNFRSANINIPKNGDFVPELLPGKGIKGHKKLHCF